MSTPLTNEELMKPRKVKKHSEDICCKCGVKYKDILGIGKCGKCFYNAQNKTL